MIRKSPDKTAMEVSTVGYMPERFITGYFELVRLGLAVDPSGQQFDGVSGSVPKRKYYTDSGGLRDEPALRFKAWVDRQLRAIGRDVQAYLNARDGKGPSPVGMSSAQRREIARELERKTELKCSHASCGKYISWQWAFCAWCGKEVPGGAKDQAEEYLRGDWRPPGSEEGSASPADHHGQDVSGEAWVHDSGDDGTTGRQVQEASRRAGWAGDGPILSGDAGSGRADQGSTEDPVHLQEHGHEDRTGTFEGED